MLHTFSSIITYEIVYRVRVNASEKPFTLMHVITTTMWDNKQLYKYIWIAILLRRWPSYVRTIHRTETNSVFFYWFVAWEMIFFLILFIVNLFMIFISWNLHEKAGSDKIRYNIISDIGYLQYIILKQKSNIWQASQQIDLNDNNYIWCVDCNFSLINLYIT